MWLRKVTPWKSTEPTSFRCRKLLMRQGLRVRRSGDGGQGGEYRRGGATETESYCTRPRSGLKSVVSHIVWNHSTRRSDQQTEVPDAEIQSSVSVERRLRFRHKRRYCAG